MKPFIILFAVLMPALLACTEKPQELVRSGHQAAKADQDARQDERRQRTLGQSESERIYQQGTLR